MWDANGCMTSQNTYVVEASLQAFAHQQRFLFIRTDWSKQARQSSTVSLKTGTNKQLTLKEDS